MVTFKISACDAMGDPQDRSPENLRLIRPKPILLSVSNIPYIWISEKMVGGIRGRG